MKTLLMDNNNKNNMQVIKLVKVNSNDGMLKVWNISMVIIVFNDNCSILIIFNFIPFYYNNTTEVIKTAWKVRYIFKKQVLTFVETTSVSIWFFLWFFLWLYLFQFCSLLLYPFDLYLIFFSNVFIDYSFHIPIQFLFNTLLIIYILF